MLHRQAFKQDIGLQVPQYRTTGGVREMDFVIDLDFKGCDLLQVLKQEVRLHCGSIWKCESKERGNV